MKTPRIIFYLLFLILFLLVGVPKRIIKDSSEIEFSSIFSTGFIDYGRLFLIILFWLSIFFLIELIFENTDIFERTKILFFRACSGIIDITLILFMTVFAAFCLDFFSRPTGVNAIFLCQSLTSFVGRLTSLCFLEKNLLLAKKYLDWKKKLFRKKNLIYKV